MSQGSRVRGALKRSGSGGRDQLGDRGEVGGDGLGCADGAGGVRGAEERDEVGGTDEAVRPDWAGESGGSSGTIRA
jgi:hypothetical protein